MPIRRRFQTTREFVGYVRVSSRKARPLLAQQEQNIRRFVEGEAGTLLQVYGEVRRETATTLPAREQAIAHAREVSATLVVTEISRLARDVHFLDDLEDITIRSSLYPRHGISQLRRSAREAMFRYVDNEDARELAQLDAVREGRPWGGAAADQSARRDRADEFARRVYVVTHILRRRGFNDNSKLARELNRIGVVTPSGRGQWHSRSVGRVIERGAPSSNVRFPRAIVKKQASQVFKSSVQFERWFDSL